MKTHKFYRLLIIGGGLLFQTVAACGNTNSNGTTGGTTMGSTNGGTNTGGTTAGAGCTFWSTAY
jgi:hypothetical protein